jgi:16S rRNA (uracil1498-N3)-methyltransferase
MASRARFYFPEPVSEGRQAALQGDEFHHLRHVLRLAPGAEISLFDGEGSEFQAVIVALGRSEAIVRVGRKESGASESSLSLHLAIGMAKGEKLDLVIQKATELGAAAIHPLATRRADVKLTPEKSGSRRDRWRRVALEACKQSGRTRLPEVHPPRTLEEFLALELPRLRVVLDPTGQPIPPDFPDTGGPDRAMIVVAGPEGGWDPDELDRLRRSGFLPLRLGPRILRVETAAILAAGLFQFLAGDLRD